MLTGKGNLKVIKKRNIETTKGLGLLRNVIIDQHFVERQRQNRLISVLIENPNHLGVGIGEDTAAIFTPNNMIHVIGDGWVQIYDTTHLRSRIDSNSNNIGGWNFKMHILRNRESFNMTSMSPQ
jgi:cyanophycinase